MAEIKMEGRQMETHKIKGNFCKKYWNDEKERQISFPSTLAELGILAKAGALKVDGKDFKVSEDALCQWAYRGFSLQHQGAEPMTEEEKGKAKQKRKAASTIVNSFAIAHHYQARI
jgi:hypothetical protein